MGVDSDTAVAAGSNGLQTDSDDIRRLAAAETATAPGGLPLGSARLGIIINCPALALPDVPARFSCEPAHPRGCAGSGQHI